MCRILSQGVVVREMPIAHWMMPTGYHGNRESGESEMTALSRRSAEDVPGQTFCHPDVWIEHFQILGPNLPAYRAEHFSVSAIEPHFGGCEVQVPDPALCPAMGGIELVSAFMTNGFVSPTGRHLNQ